MFSKDIKFHITVSTDEGLLYSQEMPPMPIPRVGEEIFVPNPQTPALGWWHVRSVDWSLPSMNAQEPTMWVVIKVSWSHVNAKDEPVYDEDRGWIEKGS